MNVLTNEKLTIVGAAGMIGSNMAQTAIMMGLTSNICLYDPYAPGLEGVAEELFHCGFEGVNITFTSDIKEALTGAKYIVNSGGAARKAGMTREDLLKGNAAIAEEFGKNVKLYCPDVKHIVIIFNPADITGLITLLSLRPQPFRTHITYSVPSIPPLGKRSSSAKGKMIEQKKHRTDSIKEARSKLLRASYFLEFSL